MQMTILFTSKSHSVCRPLGSWECDVEENFIIMIHGF